MNGGRLVTEWDDGVEGGGSPLSKGETLVTDEYEAYQEEMYLEMLEGMETGDD